MNGSAKDFINFVKTQPSSRPINHTDWNTCSVGDYVAYAIKDSDEELEFSLEDWNCMARQVLEPMIVNELMVLSLSDEHGPEGFFIPNSVNHPELLGMPSGFSTMFGVLVCRASSESISPTYGHLWEFINKHCEVSLVE